MYCREISVFILIYFHLSYVYYFFITYYFNFNRNLKSALVIISIK